MKKDVKGRGGDESLYKGDETIEETMMRLRRLLEDVIKEKQAEGTLLSGGLDTSIIAFIASKIISKNGKKLKAFTVTLEDCDTDLYYAKKVAEFLDLDHIIYHFSRKEMVEAVSITIKTIKSDEYLEVRSAVPLYIAMKVAKDHVSSLYVGDGADELFFGYNQMIDAIDRVANEEHYSKGAKKNIENYYYRTLLNDSREYLKFPLKIGRVMGIDVKIPYLDERIRKYAREIAVGYKVREEKGRKWGKWILRKSFEDCLPKEIIWREKVPIDVGTGSMTLMPF